MSKAYLNFYKKTNPLAAVLNKRNPSPSLSSRNLTQRDNSFREQQQANSKLYTFCSNDNNHLSQQQPSDQNTPINSAKRQRKVSISNIKGNVYLATNKANQKSSGTKNQREKKKHENLSIASITSLNSAFDRKKTERHVTSSNDNSKINISICINPKALRDAEEKNGEVTNRDRQKSVTSRALVSTEKKVTNQSFSALKKISKKCVEGGKSKLIFEQEDILSFSHQIAHVKYISDKKITALEQKVKSFEQLQQQWLCQSKNYQHKLQLFSQERQAYQQQISILKNKIKVLMTDNEYYLMAKDQSKKIIKEQEVELTVLGQEVRQLQEELSRYKENSLLSLETRPEKGLASYLSILEIENNHLKKQLEINDNFTATVSNYASLPLNTQASQELNFHLLKSENTRLQQQLKELQLLRINNDIHKKTIEQCTIRITDLESQIITLRNQPAFEYRSIQNSINSEPGADSYGSGKRAMSSPSEVECVIWKRENHGEDNIINEVGMFNCQFYRHSDQDWTQC